MVRHESAEALGALGDRESLGLLREKRDDGAEEQVVRETCEIAVGRIEWEDSEERWAERVQQRWRCASLQDFDSVTDAGSAFSSIDPAPPLASTEQAANIQALQKTLLDTSLSLFQRYRAMFALRDLASPPSLPTAVSAVEALASGFSDPSALFRHEIAFVFGQLSHPASIPSLVETLSNKKEASMVRHEAAEALGGLGDHEGVDEVLRGFLEDEEQVVRESVVVALDMAEFEKSGELEYAIPPTVDGTRDAPALIAGAA